MPDLFTPVTIKGLKLKNRIVMPPMATRMATPEGAVTERHLQHYIERARGGVGLIIVEYTYVSSSGRSHLNQLGLHEDKLITGLRDLTEAVHREGSRIAIQLTHAGSRTTREIIGEQPVGPSNIPVPGDKEIPRPLTVSELGVITKAFGKAARLAIEAGFDAVELHGARGYLLGQFLSPYTNKRNDVYGNTLEGRLTFPLEVITEVKMKLPEGVPLFYRFGADDGIQGGLTLEESRLIAPRLEKAGVDVLDVSNGLGDPNPQHSTQQGLLVPLAQSIKAMVTVPVIGVGNITEPEYANSIILEGKVDLVAIGRYLLSNPEFPRLAARKLGIMLN